MKKADVEMHGECGRVHPAVNVKHHLWVPDLIRKFKGNGTHEFSDDEGFWTWLEDMWEHSRYEEADGADEWARQACWEQAQEVAEEVWPTRSVTVWSEGRSGGWCVVDGLPDIDDWDAVDLAKWAKFERLVKQIAHEEYPYQFIWNLGANVWEHVREERRNLYPAPAYA